MRLAALALAFVAGVVVLVYRDARRWAVAMEPDDVDWLMEYGGTR